MATTRRRDRAGVRNARILGIVLLVGGGIALGFGWSGAARRNCVDCQMPYLISGGAVGLALIILGSGMFIVAQIRVAQDSFRDQVRQINQAVVRMGGLQGGGGNGHAVVAGQSTYHRPECAMIQGKDAAQAVTAEEAEQRGLNPCRLCEPVLVES